MRLAIWHALSEGGLSDVCMQINSVRSLGSPSDRCRLVFH